MKKSGVAVLLLSLVVLLCTGCGGPGKDTIKKDLQTELGMQPKEVSIKETKIDKNIASVTTDVVMASPGIEKAAQVTMTYQKSQDGGWTYNYSVVNNGKWEVRPTSSITQSNPEMLATAIQNKDFQFAVGVRPLKQGEFTVENPKSVSLALQKPYSETVSFTVKIDTATYNGAVKCTAKLDFNDSGWFIQDLKQDGPIQLAWKGNSGFVFDEAAFRQWLRSRLYSTITVTDVTKNIQVVLDPENITALTVAAQPQPFLDDSAGAAVNFTAVRNLATVHGKFYIQYVKQGNWAFAGLTADDKVSKVELPSEKDILGTWNGTYVISSQKRNAQLIFTNYQEANGVYEGSFQFGPSDTFTCPVGKFYITAKINPYDYSLKVDPGNWITQAPGYSTVGFSINKIESDKLSGAPGILMSLGTDFISCTKEKK